MADRNSFEITKCILSGVSALAIALGVTNDDGYQRLLEPQLFVYPDQEEVDAVSCAAEKSFGG